MNDSPTKRPIYHDKAKYAAYVKKRASRSMVGQNCARAALTGGTVCLFGQALLEFYKGLGLPTDAAATGVSVTLIFAAAMLTGFGVFDKIARVAGAGTLVPVTGFANAVVSPAIDTKSEGWIMGVGAKIFTVAGPVILYGTLSGVLYGIIYQTVRWFFS